MQSKSKYFRFNFKVEEEVLLLGVCLYRHAYFHFHKSSKEHVENSQTERISCTSLTGRNKYINMHSQKTSSTNFGFGQYVEQEQQRTTKNNKEQQRTTKNNNSEG
eukprot:scaffold18565_cov71-Skeletonema_dohrnii-CCMP3373.AAC.4